jgi:hypothetical protein
MTEPEEFQDSEPGDQHENYVKWKAANPNGFVANVLPNRPAMLHRSSCAHLSGPHQTPADSKSYTTNRKICSTDLAVLKAKVGEAAQECVSCKP